ncbi:neuraminidase [Rufibacter radiotolerans]|uniref:Neuraminidase n=1 Tax=Rufibacter radiotolerans TaxID=1379910 RepID=A0A0H4VKV9_9BACT|nr:BNR repeat-containing protein [Rufibacter radiotolerans]AKQ46435.1 neuraminidase [Rufibacter radiotolerans]
MNFQLIISIKSVWLSALIIALVATSACRLSKPTTGNGSKTTLVAEGGWANNSVNAVAFRKNSLVTFKDTQYTAWYDSDRSVMLAKRKTGGATWETVKTTYRGNAADAHNTISIMVDGQGFLHVSWDHHNHQLRYARSVGPGSLQLTGKMPMTGLNEKAISYPEFYRLPSGDLLFFYRDGGSGQGNLVVNRYDTRSRQWAHLHANLINGEKKRNAYWQAYLDKKGTMHVSWVWRESPNVASNHDLAYARSRDGGQTWEKSTGERYTLPITEATAEKAMAIPQNSELINQTSMAADEQGNPFIATYWREAGSTVPQYHLVYHDGKSWQKRQLNFRKTPFSLTGAGTKRIPIARPQVLVKNAGAHASVLLLFRDEERGNKASALVLKKLSDPTWSLVDLTQESLGSWEPTYDTELWKERQILNLFIQNVDQVDGEGRSSLGPQPVQVLEWKPAF